MKSEKITSLLHEIRSPGATFETIHELSNVARQATSDEIALAVHRYILGLLAASKCVMQLQLDVIHAERLGDEKGLH